MILVNSGAAGRTINAVVAATSSLSARRASTGSAAREAGCRKAGAFFFVFAGGIKIGACFLSGAATIAAFAVALSVRRASKATDGGAASEGATSSGARFRGGVVDLADRDTRRGRAPASPRTGRARGPESARPGRGRPTAGVCAGAAMAGAPPIPIVWGHIEGSSIRDSSSPSCSSLSLSIGTNASNGADRWDNTHVVAHCPLPQENSSLG